MARNETLLGQLHLQLGKYLYQIKEEEKMPISDGTVTGVLNAYVGL